MERVNRAKRLAKPCWFTDAADFGYGDVEYHDCGHPATHIAKDYNPYSGETDKIPMCTFHAKNRDFKRVYRFRKV